MEQDKVADVGVSVYLPKPLYDKMRQQTRREHQKVSAWVRTAIQEKLRG